MEKVNLSDLKKLREETDASVTDCRNALEEASGNYKKALDLLKKREMEKAEKKKDRQTSQGLVECYIHQNGKVGAMIEIRCETDFVARTDQFKNLAHEIAMQVAAMNPKNVDELLKQEYIRDSSLTINDLIKGVIGKLGENITLGKIARLEI